MDLIQIRINPDIQKINENLVLNAKNGVSKKRKPLMCSILYLDKNLNFYHRTALVS